jgi:orotidine-5'-phosphate decarboxylase
LLAAADECGGPVCVGLDPVYEKLPQALTAEHDDPADAGQKLDAIRRFGEGVIEAVAGEVPCVKLQLACFERYGAGGWAVYEHLLETARRRGLVTIADGKRGDIAGSSAHYAAGLMTEQGADALTVNPYVGLDGLAPFVETARDEGKGLFALVRTSNPGAEAIQALLLNDGRSVSDAVADAVASLSATGADPVGESGYAAVGAVVGATKPQAMAGLRQRMPRQLFLVPGVGAQGGTRIGDCFHPDGRGAIITASRSVIYPGGAGGEASDWQSPIREAARELRQAVAGALAGKGGFDG